MSNEIEFKRGDRVTAIEGKEADAAFMNAMLAWAEKYGPTGEGETIVIATTKSQED
ncbi:hypothetical protein [Streptomyces sp. NPDC059513]|uniref:hypothetical protein n=1 Tax=unclassified Streptomyces TaxID=2593676 RepID=UPI0036BDEC0C